MDHEIHCRLGQARAAFHEIKRPIFKNRFLTPQTRVQLMQSLVLSKMLYGSGTWYEVPRRTIQKLESTIMRFFRSILDQGFWNNSHLTDDELRVQFRLPTFRALLAIARLRFLAHIAVHDHDYHRAILYEERKYNKGWLYEIEDDLAWMLTCASCPDMPQIPHSHDTWPPFLQWLKTASTCWKSWIHRTMKNHQLRETIAMECIGFHQQIFDALKAGGFAVHQPDQVVEAQMTHSCPECLAVFTTSTGVAVHRAKKHGIHSPLRAYVQSATCPGCLRDMWTSQRVIQHLRYRPNRCLDRVIAGREPKEHVMVHLPPHLERVKRLPATRRRHGPLLPLPHEKERQALQQQLQECVAHGEERDFWSTVNPALQRLADQKLTAAAETWYATESTNGEALFCALLEASGQLPFPQLIQEKCIVNWIEQTMWSACAHWDPNALGLLEDEHIQILKILPVWLAMTERARLQRLLQSDAAPANWDPVVHIRVPHPKKRPRAYPVPMRYSNLEKDEQAWKHITLIVPTASTLASHHRVLAGRRYYVVHLYSGRRREQDIQWHLEQRFAMVAHCICILSVDTAVHEMCDINSKKTWDLLLELATSGHLLALLLGPPCETWSSARHEVLYDAEGEIKKGPRPLRSAGSPWGLNGLVPREYRQLQMGMRLLLRGLILLVHTVMHGGSVLMEHPATPKPVERASIWRTAILELLQRSGMVKTYTFGQWKYHAKGIKPTTFLYGNLDDLPAILRSYEDDQAVRPTTPLVGQDQEGNFYTSSAKEYPPLLNAAMAACVAHKWLSPLQQPADGQPEVLSDQLTDFLNSLGTVCSKIREHCSWLPDYQGR